MSKLRILILGTGGMANTHVRAYANLENVELVAGVDINQSAVDNFCDLHAIEHRFTSLKDAIDWGEFDAVSNVTPDALHYDTTMPLLQAGKHVLCEKPLATRYANAREMADAAQAAKVVNMVNFSYRNVAAMRKAVELVNEGLIGKCRHFEASYLQSWLSQPAWGDWRSESKWLWRLSTRHGSKGVLGDVGIHILDFVCFVAGSLPVDVSCRLKTFAKADGDRIDQYPLDANDSCAMNLELSNGAIGVISATRFATGHHNDLRLRLYGDLGGLEVGFEKGVERLRICAGEDIHTEIWRDVTIPAVKTIYERFVDAIISRSPTTPDFETGAALQKVLDLAEQSHKLNGQRLSV